MENPSFKNLQRPISSAEIRKNFNSESKERYIGLKIGVIMTLLAMIFSGYLILKNTSENDKAMAGAGKINGSAVTPAEKADSTSRKNSVQLKQQQALPPKPATVTAVSTLQKQNINSTANSLFVQGSNMADLRQKLKARSERLMSNGNFKPVRSILNLKNYTFQCELEDVDSLERVKLLSLLWGPVAVGCESCANALLQNPGSEVLLKKSDSQFDYNVISIR